ncbi:sodium/glutamate symporter [Aquipuribacter sp. MA13-6]|uniref:sodium/glutamate symporter n=1 Tax=unclassified Aquipuribacter TaxID=2635084 RepID=UPI003EEA4DAE
MSPETIGLSLLVLGVLLLVAKLIRIRSRTAQKLFLPSSIIGGFIALLVGPEVVGAAAVALGAGEDSLLGGGLWPASFLEVWSSLPGLLISVVFATLFLGEKIPKVKDAADLAGPQLALGVTMASGQYVIGLLLAILVLVPVFGLSPISGALIEIGFEGGHGTAAGLGDTLAELGFAEGQDLALGLATVGVVSGVVVGIAIINWGVRTGRAVVLESDAKASLAEQRGLYEKDQPPAAFMTVRSASIEPLAIHFAIVAVAILIGAALLEGLQALETLLWADTIEIFAFVPLFPLAMLGGVAVQVFADKFDRTGIIDRQMMLRLQGIALDLLIVSALATLSIQAIADNLVPFLLLAGAGLAWNFGVFAFLAQRMIPNFWFERGIGDLGQSLGVTATGIILIKVADPDGKTPAMEAFGYKQLAFEPFFGGGLITAAAIPLIAATGPTPLLLGMTALLVFSLAVGILYYGRRGERTTVEMPVGTRD